MTVSFPKMADKTAAKQIVCHFVLPFCSFIASCLSNNLEFLEKEHWMFVYAPSIKVQDSLFFSFKKLFSNQIGSRAAQI